jgi:hypothetical protein
MMKIVMTRTMSWVVAGVGEEEVGKEEEEEEEEERDRWPLECLFIFQRISA